MPTRLATLHSLQHPMDLHKRCLLSEKTPAAGNHREYEYRNRWQAPFHPQIRVSPNAIRAERSEQETDRARAQTTAEKPTLLNGGGTPVSARLATCHQYQRPKGSTVRPPTLSGTAPAAGTRTSVSLSPHSNSFDPNESKTAQ